MNSSNYMSSELFIIIIIITNEQIFFVWIDFYRSICLTDFHFSVYLSKNIFSTLIIYYFVFNVFVISQVWIIGYIFLLCTLIVSC